MHDKPVYEFSESETLERGDERSGRETSGLQASRGASILASAWGAGRALEKVPPAPP